MSANEDLAVTVHEGVDFRAGTTSEAQNRQLLRPVRAKYEDALDIAGSAWASYERHRFARDAINRTAYFLLPYSGISIPISS
jgi:hypothetical protein